MELDFGPNVSKAVQRFTLYLPERDRNGHAIRNMDYWVDEACLLLCLLNGGCTKLPPAEGMWLDDNGVPLKEPVHVIYSAVEPDRFFAQFELVRQFVQRFGRQTNQSIVMAEFNDRTYFIHVKDHTLEQTA